MRFADEIQDLRKAAVIADKWGYGNLIEYLKIVWAEKLLVDIKDRDVAARGALMDKFERRAFNAGFGLKQFEEA